MDLMKSQSQSSQNTSTTLQQLILPNVVPQRNGLSFRMLGMNTVIQAVFLAGSVEQHVLVGAKRVASFQGGLGEPVVLDWHK